MASKKEPTTAEPEKVRAGEVISLTVRAGGEWCETRPAPVLPPCDDKRNGHWACAVHQNEWTEDGPNCLDGYGRTWQGREGCRAVWVCHQHGPEQP